MKVHFVYAYTPYDENTQAPQSITKNLFHYMVRQGVEVVYDQWDAIKTPEGDPETIFVGHPHYDENTIVQSAFRKDVVFKKKCTIHPLHHGRPEDNLPFDYLAQRADRIFSICGPYWYDTIDKSPFAHWKPKITRLDMAVDTNHFHHHKTHFNPPGKRSLVYIGSSMPQKNLGLMVQIMRKLPKVTLHWYGGSGDHPLAKEKNVKVVGWGRIDHALAAKISAESDIFINTSVSDANPTTALETAAFGLVPIMTPQSGYWPMERATQPQLLVHGLPLDDVNQCVHNIKELLNTPSNRMLDISMANRKLIETYYTWDRFCKTFWDALIS